MLLADYFHFFVSGFTHKSIGPDSFLTPKKMTEKMFLEWNVVCRGIPNNEVIGIWK